MSGVVAGRVTGSCPVIIVVVSKWLLLLVVVELLVDNSAVDVVVVVTIMPLMIGSDWLWQVETSHLQVIGWSLFMRSTLEPT